MNRLNDDKVNDSDSDFVLTVSDLHLGEGCYYPDGKPNPYEDFHHDADFALWLLMKDRKYVGRSVRLHLMGDIFDPSQVRFEGELVDPPYEDAALYKMKTIVAGHPVFFEALRRWAESNNKISFFIGNHDAMLVWPKVQEFLKGVIVPQNRQLVEFVFEKIHSGTYFAHGNYDPIARLDREHLFAPSFDHRGPIINMPDDSLFHIGVINPLKLWNAYVGRMAQHRHAGVYRDALFRNWKFTRLAATRWCSVLLRSFAQFLFDKRMGRWKRLRRVGKLLGGIVFSTFWNGIFGDDLEKDAKRVLKMGYDAVVLGHTHGCVLKAIGKGWYANSGTWAMRYVIKNEKGWARLRSFFHPVFEREDQLTYVVTEHRNGRTILVKLEEFVPEKAMQ